MNLRIYKNRIFSFDVFFENLIYDLVSFRIINVEMIHSICFTSDLRKGFGKGQGMCRYINFRNNTHAVQLCGFL
ncbi:hypothetical protein D3C85_1734970 [compost metagenome]